MAAPEQLPLELSHSIATPVVRTCSWANDHGCPVADRCLAAWPSPVVVLTGPAGSGKSHLADIWRSLAHATDIHPKHGEDAALAAMPVPFSSRMPICNGFDDNELFHVINSVRENRTSLLMTARLWPMSWPVTLRLCAHV